MAGARDAAHPFVRAALTQPVDEFRATLGAARERHAAAMADIARRRAAAAPAVPALHVPAAAEFLQSLQRHTVADVGSDSVAESHYGPCYCSADEGASPLRPSPAQTALPCCVGAWRARVGAARATERALAMRAAVAEHDALFMVGSVSAPPDGGGGGGDEDTPERVAAEEAALQRQLAALQQRVAVVGVAADALAARVAAADGTPTFRAEDGDVLDEWVCRVAVAEKAWAAMRQRHWVA
jgi:hypothetical protein